METELLVKTEEQKNTEAIQELRANVAKIETAVDQILKMVDDLDTVQHRDHEKLTGLLKAQEEI